jgi:hypothetical protein
VLCRCSFESSAALLYLCLLCVRYYSELFIQVVVETEVSFVLECDALYRGSCEQRLGHCCDHPPLSNAKVKK